MIRWHWADPGETVGWARGRVLDQPGGSPPGPMLVVDDYGQDKAKTYILETLIPQTADLDLIGYESYNIRAKDLKAHLGSDVPTLQVVGMIRLAGWQEQDRRKLLFPRLTDQPPSAKSTGMAAAKLHVPELVPVIADALAGPHDDGHYGDAILHAVAWFHTHVLQGR